MNILIMRHGIAELSQDDFKRPLTEEGIQGVRQTANALVKQLTTMSAGRLSKVIASPLLRSQQTAQILIDEMKLDLELETLDLIRPESELEDFLAFLEASNEEGLYLYVSHQPFVGVLMYHLSRTEEFMDTAEVNYVSIRSYSQGGGDLKWKISA